MDHTGTQEIRREKVFIPNGMTGKQISEKYGIPINTAWGAKRKGFFVKNYSKKQIMIDRENFNPEIAYGIAGKVYRRNFAYKYRIAENLEEDLIQEAVTRLFELSGKKSTAARYSDNYAKFWIAHNAMLAFIKTWLNQAKYKEIWRNALDIARANPELASQLYPTPA